MNICLSHINSQFVGNKYVETSGINTMSSTDIVEKFSELKDDVVVEKFEKKIFPYGRRAGKLGEAVSNTNTFLSRLHALNLRHPIHMFVVCCLLFVVRH